MNDSDKIKELEGELSEIKSTLDSLLNIVKSLCRRAETNEWLNELTASERAHWDAKSEIEKDLWFATFLPAQRAGMIKSEIQNPDFIKKLLNASRRDKIRSDAEEARKRLRAKGWIKSDSP